MAWQNRGEDVFSDGTNDPETAPFLCEVDVNIMNSQSDYTLKASLIQMLI